MSIRKIVVIVAATTTAYFLLLELNDQLFSSLGYSGA